MKLAIFTNIPSPHQIPLGKAFANLLNDDFSLVCWEKGSDDRRKLGWHSNYEESWLVRAWNSSTDLSKSYELLRSTDIVIWGYAPPMIITDRIQNGDLTFRYTERLFKKGYWRLLDPRVLIEIQKKWLLYGKAHHLLSVGPYCAKDYRLLGLFPKRIWRWGYFPELPQQLLKRNSDQVTQILWVGRMLDWKQVDLLLAAVAYAIACGGEPFRLKIIGFGPEEEKLKLLSVRLGVSDICEFQGPQSQEVISSYMDEADIYVLPSNRNEGWGVVVNEAMSHGCCVIGSKQAGSVPWLIQDGVNGRIFDGNSLEDLGRIIRWSVDNPEARRKLGLAARKTITQLWSPSTAAERFLTLCENLGHNNSSPGFSDDGPCSLVY